MPEQDAEQDPIVRAGLEIIYKIRGEPSLEEKPTAAEALSSAQEDKLREDVEAAISRLREAQTAKQVQRAAETASQRILDDSRLTSEMREDAVLTKAIFEDHIRKSDAVYGETEEKFTKALESMQNEPYEYLCEHEDCNEVGHECRYEDAEGVSTPFYCPKHAIEHGYDPDGSLSDDRPWYRYDPDGWGD